MRILKWLFGIIVVLGVIFLAGGLLLPREVSVARSIEIEAAPDEIFPHLNSLQAMADWSPWLERDPDVAITYSGPEEGVGGVMEWSSEVQNVGSGRQEITASVPGERVETALDFGDMGTGRADLLLEPAGGATTVIWTLDTDMGAGPVGRWMGLMMDGFVGADYEAGLNNLKALVEG